MKPRPYVSSSSVPTLCLNGRWDFRLHATADALKPARDQKRTSRRRECGQERSGGHASLDTLLAELVAEALSPDTHDTAQPTAQAREAHSVFEEHDPLTVRCRAVTALIRGVISTGFSLLDAGWADDVVVSECTRASRAILTAPTEAGDAAIEG